MKVSQEDFEDIKESIAPYLSKQAIVNNYMTGNFPRSEKVKDLNKRFRWDLLYMSKGSDFISSLHDKGLHEGHIDTALRKIVPQIPKKY